MGYEKSCADQELKVSNVLNPPQVSNQAVEAALDISSQQVNSKCTSASSSGTNDAEEFLIGFDEFDSTFAQMDEEQVEQMCSGTSTANNQTYSPIQITDGCIVTTNQYRL